MKNRSAISLFLVVSSILLHLIFCQWRTLEMRDTWSTIGPDGKMYYGSDSSGTLSSSETLSGFEQILNNIGESLERSSGAIWMNTDMFGEGIGLYARGEMDVGVAKLLGVVLPVVMMIVVPIVLMVGKKSASVAVLYLAFAMLSLNLGGCVKSQSQLDAMSDQQLYEEVHYAKFGVAGFGGYYNQVRQTILDKHPEWSEQTKEDIRAKRIHTGMSKLQVVASWGTPTTYRQSVYIGASVEMWIYGVVPGEGPLPTMASGSDRNSFVYFNDRHTVVGFSQ